MRVTLVQPPNLQKSGEWKKQQVYRTPTNIALLASYVRERGHEVNIIDFDIRGGNANDMAEQIMKSEPQIIGFTCLTPRFPIVIKIAQHCKTTNKDVVVVVGGPHVTGLPQHALKDPAIDYGIIGEGEEVLLEVLDLREKGKDISSVPGLILRHDKGVRINPVRPFIKNLDVLPLPAWDLLENLSAYVEPNFFYGPHFGLLSGRGCAWYCNFCASEVTWKRKVRFHSSDYVINLIENAVNRFGIREFQFYDDTFTINHKRTLAICKMILERKLDIRFYVQARADCIDFEIVDALKKAGCFCVAIGVESGDEKILSMIGKGEIKEQFRMAAKVLKKAKMPFLASYIIGHPSDTHESIRATLDFASELDADESKFMIATPYPGTPLFKMVVERKIIKEDEAENLESYTWYQRVAANLSLVSDEDLLNYQQEAYDKYERRKRPLVLK